MCVDSMRFYWIPVRGWTACPFTYINNTRKLFVYHHRVSGNSAGRRVCVSLLLLLLLAKMWVKVKKRIENKNQLPKTWAAIGSRGSVCVCVCVICAHRICTEKKRFIIVIVVRGLKRKTGFSKSLTPTKVICVWFCVVFFSGHLRLALQGVRGI